MEFIWNSLRRNRHFRDVSPARRVRERYRVTCVTCSKTSLTREDEGNTCDAHVRERTCVPYACTDGAGGKRGWIGGQRARKREKERERERERGERQAPPFARGIFSATYKSPLCSATSVVAHVHACALVYGACYK
jgi:hypothetical protein